MAAKIKKGDRVSVIAGSEKGRQGTVLRCYADDRVLVEDITVKRHTKPNPQRNVEGGIVEKPKPIHVSNLALVDAQGKPTRVGFKTLENGRKVRFAKTNKEIIDV